MKENVIQLKTFEFAVRIVKLYQYLVEEKKNGYFQNKYLGVVLPLVQIPKKHWVGIQKKICIENRDCL